MKLGFSPWHKFTPTSWNAMLKLVPKEPGVYALKEPELFRRYNFKSDLVYIGCTKSKDGLRQRIGFHTKGNKSQKTSFRIHKWLRQRPCLQICWREVREGLCRKYEKALLLRYLSDHWELPPLNRSM